MNRPTSSPERPPHSHAAIATASVLTKDVASAQAQPAPSRATGIAAHLPGLRVHWDRLVTQWHQSRVYTFLSWWQTGLLDCLPDRVRSVLARRDADIVLVLAPHAADAKACPVSHDDGGEQSAKVGVKGSVEVIDGLDRAFDAPPGTRVILLLPRRAVLVKPMRFPAAARHNLRAAASFELDRHTPFTRDQAAFDVCVRGDVSMTTPSSTANPDTTHDTRHDTRNDTQHDIRHGARHDHDNALDADLVVMPKARLDALTQQIAASHWPLHGVDVMTHDGRRWGINLLDPASRAPRRQPERRLTVWLGAALLTLTIVACYQWQSAREAALTQMQSRLDTMRVAARAVMRLREQVRDQASMAGYLTRLKANRPGMDTLLLQITTALPDDSWLQQLEVDATGQVRLAGLSAHATALLGHLQQADALRDVSFQGAIEPDQQTHLDHFYLAGRLSVPSSPTPLRHASPPSSASASEHFKSPLSHEPGHHSSDPSHQEH